MQQHHLQLRVLLELEDHGTEHVALLVVRRPILDHVLFVRVRQGKSFVGGGSRANEVLHMGLMNEFAGLVIVLRGGVSDAFDDDGRGVKVAEKSGFGIIREVKAHCVSLRVSAELLLPEGGGDGVAHKSGLQGRYGGVK